MNFLDKMERRFGRYAIPNLMRYIVVLYVIGIFIQMTAPEVYFMYLMLDARALLRGQIWRVITFMIWPPTNGLLLNALIVYCYYNLGNVLENVWGAFRFNLFFLIGILGHVLAAIVIYLVFGMVYPLTTDYLNFSLFFAIAFMFPETRFYLFFAIPIKAKWLALFDGAVYLYGLIFGGAATRVAIVLSFANVMIFFLLYRGSRYNPKEIRRKQKFRAQMDQAERAAKTAGRHRCAVCGRTDQDFPNLTFRFCSKCEGNYEYCEDHLYTHQHVTLGGMDPRQAGQGRPS